jgi:hypothetical protein
MVRTHPSWATRRALTLAHEDPIMARRVPGSAPWRCQVLPVNPKFRRIKIVALMSAWVLAGAGCTTSALEPTEQTLSVEQMQAAIDLVETSVAQVHLSAVEAPPTAFESAVAMARGRASEPLSEAEFFIVLSETAAALDDAHTRIELDPSEGERLDLPILWLEEGPVVVRDAGELRRGDLVLRIGSRAAADVLAQLATFVPHENEGHVRATAPELLVREQVLRGMHLLDSTDAQDIEIVVDRDGVEHTLTLALGEASEPVEDRPWFGYEVNSERGYGLFWLDRCELTAEYLGAVDAFFAELAIAGIQHVVVDLSRNPGGNSVVAFAFLRHLDTEYLAFSVDQRISTPVLEAYPIYADPAFQQALASIGIDAMSEVWPMPGAFLAAGIEMQLPPIPEDAHYFGRVDAIIGPQTFSSGHLFAIMIEDTQLGELAGEPTGNETSFQGQIVRLPIPGMSLQLSVSSARNLRPDPAVADADELAPTIPAPWTRDQIRDGTNAQLEALLAD